MLENQIWTDLIGFINTAMTGITGWSVLQNYQPTKGNYNRPYVLVHKLSETPIGQLQVCSFNPTNGGQIFQLTYQLDAVCFRKPSDTEETLTSMDVLKQIRNWFMSDAAAQTLRQAGYNVFRISQIVTPPFLTETDTFQINPNFTLDLVYKQQYEQEISAITSAVENIIKGV